MFLHMEGTEPTRTAILRVENVDSTVTENKFVIHAMYCQIYRDKELFPPGVGIYYLDGRSGKETADFLNGARYALSLDIESDIELCGNPISETALTILREMYFAAKEFPNGIWEVSV